MRFATWLPPNYWKQGHNRPLYNVRCGIATLGSRYSVTVT
jgi:hypothetical protein